MESKGYPHVIEGQVLTQKTTNERMKQFIAIMSIYKIQNLQLLHMGFIKMMRHRKPVVRLQ